MIRIDANTSSFIKVFDIKRDKKRIGSAGYFAGHWSYWWSMDMTPIHNAKSLLEAARAVLRRRGATGRHS